MRVGGLTASRLCQLAQLELTRTRAYRRTQQSGTRCTCNTSSKGTLDQLVGFVMVVRQCFALLGHLLLTNLRFAASYSVRARGLAICSHRCQEPLVGYSVPCVHSPSHPRLPQPLVVDLRSALCTPRPSYQVHITHVATTWPNRDVLCKEEELHAPPLHHSPYIAASSIYVAMGTT